VNGKEAQKNDWTSTSTAEEKKRKDHIVFLSSTSRGTIEEKYPSRRKTNLISADQISGLRKIDAVAKGDGTMNPQGREYREKERKRNVSSGPEKKGGQKPPGKDFFFKKPEEEATKATTVTPSTNEDLCSCGEERRSA